jgi:hypothetical protein
MELDKLLVKIEADLSDLKRGLDKANNEVKKSSSKMSNSFKKFGSTLDNVGGKVIKFGGLLAGAFGAYQIKQVVDVGSQIENLQVRLKALFGTAEEGAKAFDVMTKFASRVPFSLEEIQSASGNLAVVAKDSEELAEILEITGNVASVTGLSFNQTAEQIQRSLSGGIASADVFREKGVRNLLGFQAGAEVTASQTAKAFRRVFGRGGEFGNATDELANTLTGTLSMLNDKLFSFRRAIAEDFFKEIKRQFKDLDTTLQDNEATIQKFGRDIGRSLAEFTRSVVDNLDSIMLAFKALGAFIATSVVAKIGFAIARMNPIVRGIAITLGVLQVALDKLGISFNKTANGIGDHNKALRNLNKIYDLSTGKLRKFEKQQDDSIDKNKEQFITLEDIKEITEEVGKTFDDAGKEISSAFGDAIVKGGDFKDAMVGILKDVASQIIATTVQILFINDLLEKLKGVLKDIKEGFEQASFASSNFMAYGYNTGGFGGTGGFTGGGGNDAPVGTAVGTAIGTSFGGPIGGAIGGAIGGMLGFANGGYTPPNKPYMVGERGAEMFVPRTAGNVVANHDLGGGITVNQNISFSTGVVPTVRAEVLNLLPTIKQETINAVAEQRSRGGAFARTFGA